MALTILEGSTFCICDARGDIDGETSGFFTDDMRFLSVFRLRIDGQAPLLLSSGQVEYYSAAFYLRNPLNSGLPQDSLAIARERFVGDSMQEQIIVENVHSEALSFELSLDVAADFVDIFTVKDRDFALGDPVHAAPLPPPVEGTFDQRGNQLVFDDVDETRSRTQVVFSQVANVNGGTVSYPIDLEPRGTWELTVNVVPRWNERRVAARPVARRFGYEVSRMRDSLAAWQLRVPELKASWDELEHAFERSVYDLASLRMRGGGLGHLPAAGMPWFMTVFGRDTLITSLQTLVLGSELAHGALETLAELQATEDDPSIDAEPGKIVHEVRRGKAARRWFERYYGSVDATPLYLILLSEVWRWTDDPGIVRRFRQPALLALQWIDEYGDRDGDGFVEFERRSDRGLTVQSWKDSGDSQRFSDARLAMPPIAPCEVQGYVYDAKLRLAEIARDAWRDRALADRLESEAADLKQRFNDRFWVDARGGYYALALDRDKRPVDSMCSNTGHLLWSGIVPDDRADAVADALMAEPLWSGWGVRTMSTGDAAYNPLSYHNGTVWPHDNSLIALGLARYGRYEEAQRIVRAVIDASAHFQHQLPEVFAGLPRAETPFPIAYPTAARPQAWAAGTPILALQVLLGLRPDRRRQTLVSDAGELPSWAGSLRLSGVRAFGKSWDVRVRHGKVGIVQA